MQYPLPYKVKNKAPGFINIFWQNFITRQHFSTPQRWLYQISCGGPHTNSNPCGKRELILCVEQRHHFTSAPLCVQAYPLKNWTRELFLFRKLRHAPKGHVIVSFRIEVLRSGSRLEAMAFHAKPGFLYSHTCAPAVFHFRPLCQSMKNRFNKLFSGHAAAAAEFLKGHQ